MPSKAKTPAKAAARKANSPPVKRAPPAAHATAISKRVHKSAPSTPAPLPVPDLTGTKQSHLIAMLRSPSGTSIQAMTGATGWQPHTVRGVISGVLRKRLGLNVSCSAPDASGGRTYRIVDAAKA